MIEQVVRLIYPPSLRQHPILNELIRTYVGLTVNIIRADVSESASWLELQFVGSAALIESAISWLRDKGIEIQTLGA